MRKVANTEVKIWKNLPQHPQSSCPIYGSGDSSVMERQTPYGKVASSSPGGSGGRMLFSMVNFLCWPVFRYSFHSHVTTVACKKDPGHSAQSAGIRLQLNTCAPYEFGLEWSDTVNWSLVVRCTQKWAETATVSRGTSHITTKQRCMYTTSVSIQKRAKNKVKKLHNKIQSLIQNRKRQERSASAGERKITVYKSNRQLNCCWQPLLV